MSTKLVGIVNVTPDSFSDGGQNEQLDAALETIARMVEDGADVIDIGAESTRPGATPIDAATEWSRLEHLLPKLEQFDVDFSLDTRHAETARKAAAYNITYLNDVSGFDSPAMVEAARDSDCKLIVMHSLSVPADKNLVLPESLDVVEELLHFAHARFATLEAAGIRRDRLIFDPGIGFGKTPKQSLALLRDIALLDELGVPVLVGHSRKSFLSEFKGNRDDATLFVSHHLARSGVDYLRIHDVARHRQMLNLIEGLYDGRS